MLQNPKSQEPVTLDFLDAELENDIKVEVRSTAFLVPGACILLCNNWKAIHVLDFEWKPISLKNFSSKIQDVDFIEQWSYNGRFLQIKLSLFLSKDNELYFSHFESYRNCYLNNFSPVFFIKC